jgi:hypothetical protein
MRIRERSNIFLLEVFRSLDLGAAKAWRGPSPGLWLFNSPDNFFQKQPSSGKGIRALEPRKMPSANKRTPQAS